MSSKGPSIDVRVSNPGDNVVANNAVAAPAPPGYYVVLGRGASAWYNHLTLLQTDWGRLRMSENGRLLPVMHLGYEEPWVRRGHERMGQPPRMLDFFKGITPGLGLRNGLDERDWLPASEFAATVSAAERHVYTHYSEVELTTGNFLLALDARPRDTRLVLRDGFVGLIELHADWLANHPGYVPAPERARAAAAVTPVGTPPTTWLNPACPYRLSVYHNGNRSFVYAHKIDICTGPGQPRLFDRAMFASDELYREHFPPRGVIPTIRPADQGFPRILDGNEYIGSPNDRHKSVLVFKGNPVGAQSAQSALDMPLVRDGQRAARVWWVMNEDIRAGNAADVPGRRNLLEIIGDSPLVDGEAAGITANHPDGDRWATQEHRDARLKNKLYRIGWHEITRISEGTPGAAHGTRHNDVAGIKCTFSFHPYGDVRRPVAPTTPARASRTVYDLLRRAAPTRPALAEGLELGNQPNAVHRARLDARGQALLDAIAEALALTADQVMTQVEVASPDAQAALCLRAGDALETKIGLVVRTVRNLKVRINAPFHPSDGLSPRVQAQLDLDTLVTALKAPPPMPQHFFAYLQIWQRGQIDVLVQTIGDAPGDDEVEALIVQYGTALRQETRQLVETLKAIFVEQPIMVRSITADLFVYSLGQERGVRAEGTVAYMTQRLGNLVPMHHAGSGFPMAITDTRADADAGGGWGRVRVLGAAMLGGPTDGTVVAFGTGHVQHGATLPQEAPAGGPPAGGGGYNLAMTNIRRANRFLPTPARLNTFSQDELVTAGLSADAATAIIVARSMTDRGFTPAEYAARLAGDLAIFDPRDTGFADDILLIAQPAWFTY